MELLTQLSAGFILAAPVCGYIFRETFAAWLVKQSKIEVESYKAEISRLSEHLKYDLQKNVLKAEHHVTSLNSIYPELYQQIRITEGSISGLFGFRYSPDWSTLTPEEIEKTLVGKNAPTIRIEKIISEIKANRKSGEKFLDEYFRETEFSEAHSNLGKLMNLIVLKEIFLSEAVSEHAFEIHKTLVSAKVNGEMLTMQTGENKKWYDDMQTDLTSAVGKISELKKIIKNELEPK